MCILSNLQPISKTLLKNSLLSLALLISLSSCSGNNGANTAEPNLTSAREESSTIVDVQSPQLTSEPTAQPVPLVLSSTVYTETEIELFWERASADSGIVEYHIFRDQVPLAQLDALSYFDNTVNPGTTYNFTVNGMDDRGQIVSAAQINIETPTPYSAINSDNKLEITRYIVSIINEEKFRKFQNLLANVRQTVTSSDPIEISDSAVGTHKTFACIGNEGTLLRRLSNSIQDRVNYSTYENCQPFIDEDLLINGEIRTKWVLIRYAFNVGSQETISYSNVEIQNSDNADNPGNELIAMNLSQSIRPGSLSFRSWVENGFPYEDSLGDHFYESAFGGATFINEVAIQRSSGATTEPDAPPPSSRLSAGFQVQSRETGNKPVMVSTTEEFIKSPAEQYYATGRLEITAEDGNQITIDADTGDVNSFELTLEIDGTISTEIVSWSSGNFHLLDLDELSNLDNL